MLYTVTIKLVPLPEWLADSHPSIQSSFTTRPLGALCQGFDDDSQSGFWWGMRSQATVCNTTEGTRLQGWCGAVQCRVVWVWERQWRVNWKSVRTRYSPQCAIAPHWSWHDYKEVTCGLVSNCEAQQQRLLLTLPCSTLPKRGSCT